MFPGKAALPTQNHSIQREVGATQLYFCPPVHLCILSVCLSVCLPIRVSAQSRIQRPGRGGGRET